MPALAGDSRTLLLLHGRNTMALPFVEAPAVVWSARIKRAMDVVISMSALLVLAPLVCLGGAAFRLTAPGPLLYRQWRQGRDGVPFEILKFRTLDSEGETGPFRQVLPGDPRITQVGRLLRRSRLDELPQFWNVLRGEMSLVGPRPHAVPHGAHCAALLPAYNLRLRAKPGMTGLAQVSGLIGPIADQDDLQRRLDKDLAYIRNWSLGLDLSIMLRTPRLWLARIGDDAGA